MDPAIRSQGWTPCGCETHLGLLRVWCELWLPSWQRRSEGAAPLCIIHRLLLQVGAAGVKSAGTQLPLEEASRHPVHLKRKLKVPFFARNYCKCFPVFLPHNPTGTVGFLWSRVVDDMAWVWGKDREVRRKFGWFCGSCSLSNLGKVSACQSPRRGALCYMICVLVIVTSLLAAKVHSCVAAEREKACYSQR